MLEALKNLFTKKSEAKPAEPSKEDKPPQPGNWREDRERLRKETTLDKTNKPRYRGLTATLLYALISHMHGRLHMRSYGAKKGGWNAWKAQKRDALAGSELEKFKKRYGDCAQTYYEGSIIETLDDQAAFIRQHWSQNDFENDEIDSIMMERILSDNYEKPA